MTNFRNYFIDIFGQEGKHIASFATKDKDLEWIREESLKLAPEGLYIEIFTGISTSTVLLNNVKFNKV
jgi:hypothetical protein